MSKKIYPITFHSLFSLKGALLVCLICTGIFSCKKDLSDADNLQARLGNGMVSYVQGSNVVALNGESYNFTPYYVGIPIVLSEAAKSAEEITAAVDPSLVAQYNQLYQEKNPTIPEGAFQVSHQGNFPLASGSTQAADSLYVVLNDGLQLKDSTIYLIPVTLSAKSGSKLKYSLFFFKVFVTKGELKAKMHGGSVFGGTSFGRTGYGALSAAYSTVPDSLKFRLTLNTLFPAHDVLIQAVALTDDEVNEVILKEGFPGYPAPAPVPASNYILSKDLVTVPARLLLSKDSVTIRFPDKANFPKNQWYVMGLKVKTYTGSPYGVPPVANDSTRAYIRFFISN